MLFLETKLVNFVSFLLQEKIYSIAIYDLKSVFMHLDQLFFIIIFKTYNCLLIKLSKNADEY